MKAFLTLAVCLVSVSAFARPDTTTMSCNAAKSKVNNAGSIVLGIGNQGIYDLFHSRRNACKHGEEANRAYVRTMDMKKCKVGFVCKDRETSRGSVYYSGVIRKCKDGQRAIFYETDVRNPDRQIQVIRTCKNGRYYPYKPQPTPRKCVEGKRGTRSMVNNGRFPGEDHWINVAAICKGGKYVAIRPLRLRH
ncbi:MAG: hypothetical protein CME70_17050 [Halobacteriovorax sp.]|nr:hypothetical protein [Halobacteriovorax sp.]